MSDLAGARVRGLAAEARALAVAERLVAARADRARVRADLARLPERIAALERTVAEARRRVAAAAEAACHASRLEAGAACQASGVGAAADAELVAAKDELSAASSGLDAARAQVADARGRTAAVEARPCELLAELAGERVAVAAAWEPWDALLADAHADAARGPVAGESPEDLVSRLADAHADAARAGESPEDVISLIATDLPLALLPVRLETRFAGGDLLVRVFPDVFRDALPDRWIGLGYRGGERRFAVLGRPVSSGSAVDFEDALAQGMALRIPLTLADSVGFDRLVVLGVRASSDGADSAERLAAVLEAHRQGEGLALVAPGTPTKRTDETRPWGCDAQPSSQDGSASHPPNAPARAREGARRSGARGANAGPGPDGVAPAPVANGDGTLLARALGLSPERVAGVGGTSIAAERDMRVALWPATWGSFFDRLVGEVSVDAIAAAREHFVANVTAGGALPALRVGRQPYGVLPAMSLRRWRLLDPTDLEAHLVPLLTTLAEAWRLALPGVPAVSRGADLAPALVAALAMGPVSTRLAARGLELQTDDAAACARVEQALQPIRALGLALDPLLARTVFAPGATPLGESPAAFAALVASGVGGAPQSGEVQDALGRLSSLPPAELARLAGGVLDLASHRLDAWVSSLATRRLAALRARRPEGVRIGGYGVLENVRPGVAGPSHGFVHAPSPARAATAAVLRSAQLANGGGAPLALDLSSERVRSALDVLEGLRNGLSLGAVLGAHFERGLHENHRQLALERSVMALRLLAPLDAIAVGEQDLCTARERREEATRLLADLRRQRDAAKAADAQLLGRLAAALSAFDAARADARDLTARLATARDDLQILLARRPSDFPAILEWRARIAAARSSTAILELRVARATQTLASRSLSLDALRGRRESTAAQVAALGRHVCAQANAVEATSAAVAAATATLNDLRATTRPASATARRGPAARGAAPAAHPRTVAARGAEVVDGLGLRWRWRAGVARARWDSATIPFGSAGLPMLSSAEGQAIDAELRVLDDVVDALADLLLAEGVHQVVQGDVERAVAAVDVFSRGDVPTSDIEIARASEGHTTGVGFHVAQPTARAPQAILLAVAPDEAHVWSLENLEATVLETLELARLRLIDAEALAAPVPPVPGVPRVGHYLPAIYVPAD